MTVKVERENMSAQELRKLAGRVKDGRVSRRLLAIAMVLEGMRRKVAAESCGMDRQTLRDWIRRYNAEGVEGLGNRCGGGVKLRFTSDQMAQLATSGRCRIRVKTSHKGFFSSHRIRFVISPPPLRPGPFLTFP